MLENLRFSSSKAFPGLVQGLVLYVDRDNMRIKVYIPSFDGDMPVDAYGDNYAIQSVIMKNGTEIKINEDTKIYAYTDSNGNLHEYKSIEELARSEYAAKVFREKVKEREIKIEGPHIDYASMISSSGGTGSSYNGTMHPGQKYNLTEDEIERLAKVMYAEYNGDQKGEYMTCSHCPNLFEYKRWCNATSYTNIVDYVLKSGWYAPSAVNNNTTSDSVRQAVRDCIVNGNRTIPVFVTEFDGFSEMYKWYRGMKHYLQIDGKSGSSASESRAIVQSAVQGKSRVSGSFGGEGIFWDAALNSDGVNGNIFYYDESYRKYCEQNSSVSNSPSNSSSSTKPPSTGTDNTVNNSTSTSRSMLFSIPESRDKTPSEEDVPVEDDEENDDKTNSNEEDEKEAKKKELAEVEEKYYKYPWAQVCTCNFMDSDMEQVMGRMFALCGDESDGVVPALLPNEKDRVWLAFQGGNSGKPVYVGNVGKDLAIVGKDWITKIKEAYKPFVSYVLSNSGGGGTGSGTSGNYMGTSAQVQKVLEAAVSKLGCTYAYGAEGPDTFDCSGFVKWCYGQAGIDLPHGTQYLMTCGTAVNSTSDLLPGDLIIWSKDESHDKGAHAVMVLSSTEIIQCGGTAHNVNKDSISYAIGRYNERPIKALRRICQPDPSYGSSTGGKYSKYIIVGDSRTVGMKSYCGGNSQDVWICKSSMGLDWMEQQESEISRNISTNTAIIILMGVNDIYNVNRYIEYVNSQASSAWKNASVYFVSVNPVDDNRSVYVKNSEIENFNSKIRSGLKGVSYIDTYNKLDKSSIKFDSEGLHYDQNTYKKIYKLIKS